MVQFENEEAYWISKDSLKECNFGRAINYRKNICENENSYNTELLKVMERNFYKNVSKIEEMLKKCEKRISRTFIKNTKTTEKIGSFAESYFYAICFYCKQLGIIDDFSKEVTGTHFDWIGKKRYDFLIVVKGIKYIIELHGEQHYIDTFKFGNERGTLKFNQENDKEKRLLAYKNGFSKNTYFEIDCRKSNYNYIMNNLENSISHLIDFDSLDIPSIIASQLSELSKNIANLWNQGYSTVEISELTNLSKYIINRRLDECSEGGMLKNYSLEEKYKRANELLYKKDKIVMIDPNTKEFKIFERAIDIQVELGIPRSGVQVCCEGKQKRSRGMIFKFYDEFDENKIDDYIRETEMEKREVYEVKKHYFIFIIDKENNRTYIFENIKQCIASGFVKNKLENLFKNNETKYNERFTVERRKIHKDNLIIKENEIFYYEGLNVTGREFRKNRYEGHWLLTNLVTDTEEIYTTNELLKMGFKYDALIRSNDKGTKTKNVNDEWCKAKMLKESCPNS